MTGGSATMKTLDKKLRPLSWKGTIDKIILPVKYWNFASKILKFTSCILKFACWILKLINLYKIHTNQKLTDINLKFTNTNL